jgi:hypothetical protein
VKREYRPTVRKMENINGYSRLYIDKSRYDIQEQKEVAVWYIGIYGRVSNTGYTETLNIYNWDEEV